MRRQFLALVAIVITLAQAYVPVAVGDENPDLRVITDTNLLYRFDTYARLRIPGNPNFTIPEHSIVRIQSISEKKTTDSGRERFKPKEDKYCMISPSGQISRSRFTYGFLNMQHYANSFMNSDDRFEFVQARSAVLRFLRKNSEAREELREIESSSYRLDDADDVFSSSDDDDEVQVQYIKLMELINKACR